ncbi:MAG: hypothetical protein DRG78_18860 [Epsilonproteobacteria bacterium]|nr:MAG: hypothetical protein DRG78_18860 [Campylobacterota bacterium]
MLENIALIKEVHEQLATDKAQAIARKFLLNIDEEEISLKRLSACSSIEVFYVQFIRALMTKEMSIIIIAPFSLIENLGNINDIIDKLKLINRKKNILILDRLHNETHYEGCPCNIVK